MVEIDSKTGSAQGSDRGELTAKIQILREKTNAGFMKCKQALAETDGDIDKAVDWLRAQGIKALEKMSTDTKEGYFGFYQDDSGACYVELLCVTDFVSKNEIFIASSNEVAKNLKTQFSSIVDNAGNITKELSEIIPNSIDKILSLKENIKIGRYIVMNKSGTEEIYNYSHYSGENKIAVLVKLSEKSDKGKDIAVHIASANPAPIAISTDQISQEIIDIEISSAEEQLKMMDKPENIKQKILQSRIESFKQERTLLKQPFFKDTKLTVGDYLEKVQILEFTKIKIGEP